MNRPRTMSPRPAPVWPPPSVTVMTEPLMCTRSTPPAANSRSEEHTSELQSLMRISYAVFCLKKKKTRPHTTNREIRIKHNITNRIKNHSIRQNSYHKTDYAQSQQT